MFNTARQTTDRRILSTRIFLASADDFFSSFGEIFFFVNVYR